MDKIKKEIKEIKYNRIPGYEKYIIDILEKLKIISNERGVIFYGIDDRNMIILSGEILSVKITIVNHVTALIVTDYTDFDMNMYHRITDTVKTSISKLFKQYVLDIPINKVETFGKTMQ